MKQLTDQIAVVTGAGSGIGKAIALALGEKGQDSSWSVADVTLLDEVAAALAAIGVDSVVYAADLADRDGIRNLADAITRDFRKLDVLVHNAGIVRMGDVAEASADDFELLYRTNVLAFPADSGDAATPPGATGPGRIYKLVGRRGGQSPRGTVCRDQARLEGLRRQSPGGGKRRRNPRPQCFPRTNRHANSGTSARSGAEALSPRTTASTRRRRDRCDQFPAPAAHGGSHRHPHSTNAQTDLSKSSCHSSTCHNSTLESGHPRGLIIKMEICTMERRTAIRNVYLMPKLPHAHEFVRLCAPSEADGIS